MTDNTRTEEKDKNMEEAANPHTADEKDQNQEQAESNEMMDESTEKSNKSDSKESDPLTELQEKYAILNDKYLRLYSEFENYRRRTAKEKLDAMKNAGVDILKEVLPVMDDFDRAIIANDHNNDIDNIKEGFKLIHHKLHKMLESRGVKPMNAHEKPFDTNFHEAITNVPAPKEELKGKVVDVAEKGYFFHDNVLRYAKVVVGQ